MNVQQDKDVRERQKPPQGGAGELKGCKDTAGGDTALFLSHNSGKSEHTDMMHTFLDSVFESPMGTLQTGAANS